jgi:hypothetical protein
MAGLDAGLVERLAGLVGASDRVLEAALAGSRSSHSRMLLDVGVVERAGKLTRVGRGWSWLVGNS